LNITYIRSIIHLKELFMKKTFFNFALFAVVSIAFSASESEVKPPLKASGVYMPVGNTGQMISLLELSQIPVKNFEKLTGRDMKFVDRIGFKLAQKKLKNSINENGTFSKKQVEKYFTKAGTTGGFHAGGFFLGLLGLIGVLIAYLINDDKKKNRTKWAWIGFAAGVAIALIFFAIVGPLN